MSKGTVKKKKKKWRSKIKYCEIISCMPQKKFLLPLLTRSEEL